MAVSAQSDRQSYKIAIGLLLFVALLYAIIPRNADLRDFDPQSNTFDPNGRNIISGNSANGVYVLGGAHNLVAGDNRQHRVGKVALHDVQMRC